VHLLIIYLCTRFHVPNTSVSLDTII